MLLLASCCSKFADMALRTTRFRGDRLRQLRKGHGWSQSDLARRISAHVTSVSDWERGDNAPSGRHVASLSRELGVPVEQFYEADEDEESALPSHAEMLEALMPLARLLARVNEDVAA